MKKTWFITGASRGLGLALANAAIRRGDVVIGTSRETPPPFAKGPGSSHFVQLDLAASTTRESVAATVKQAFAIAAGPIDVVVNNAGYGLLGALEDASDADMQRLFDVNVFGSIRVIQAALPYLRHQGKGHIVNVTSIAGRAPMAAFALYAAAKSALEGLTSALAQEVASLGIHVTAVAPGAFRTDFLAPTSMHKSAMSEAYAGGITGQAVARLDGFTGKQAGDPDRAAAAIVRVVDAEKPPVHLLLGPDALKRTNAAQEAMFAEQKEWETVTNGTDYPE